MWPPYSKDVSVRVIVTSSRFKAECREYSVRLSENSMIDRMKFNALEPVNSSIALKLRRWMITRVRGTTLPRECQESRRGCKKSAVLPNMGSVQLWLACPAATCRAIRRRLPVDPKILSHRLNVFDYGTSHVSHPILPQVGRVSTWSNRRVEG